MQNLRCCCCWTMRFNEASDSSVASLISEGVAKPTVLRCEPSLRPITNSVDNILSLEGDIFEAGKMPDVLWNVTFHGHLFQF